MPRKGNLKRGAAGYRISSRDPSGKVIWKTFETLQEGRDWQLEQRKRNRMYRKGEDVPVTDNILFKDACAVWLQDGIRMKERTYSTTKSYSGKLRVHVLPYIGHRPLSEINTAVISSLMDKLQFEHGLGNATRNRVLAILKSFYTSARAKKWVKVNAADGIGMKKENPEAAVTLWTEEQCQTYLDHAAKAHPVFYVLLQLNLNTGMRKGEMCALMWKHYDAEKGIITVNQILSQEEGLVQRVKGDGQKKEVKTKYVGVTPTLAKVLGEHYRRSAHKGPDDFILGQGGKHLDVYHVNRVHSRLEAQVGLPHCRIHDFRHMAATFMRRKLKDIYAVKATLGHSTVTTTERYTHFTKDDASNALSKFDTFRHRSRKGQKVKIPATDLQQNPGLQRAKQRAGQSRQVQK